MTPTLLSVRGLRKYFPARARWRRNRPELPESPTTHPAGRSDQDVRDGVLRAVDDISFDIAPGETLGLVGESGCGKSTTGRCILRLIEPTSGAVTFAGQDILSLDKAELRAFRRRAQIVFQDPLGSLNPRMRAGSVIEEVLRVHGLGGATASARGRTVERLLERVGLGAEHLRRFPHELSGGQRQRLGVARALAVEPDFLVLDEPVSALDVSVRAQIVNLLIDLQRDLGLTYLFIAHDIRLVEYVSDRIAVMHLGRIVEEGPSRAVVGAPTHPYTRRLLSAVPGGSLTESTGSSQANSQGGATTEIVDGDAPRV